MDAQLEPTRSIGGRGPGLIALCVVFSTITMLFVGCRLAHCVRTRRFHLDDALATLAMLITFVESGILIAAATYGDGKHIYDLDYTTLPHIVLAIWLSSPVGCFAFLQAKLSVGVTLLKLNFGKVFNLIVYVNIVICFVINLWSAIVQLTGCNSYHIVSTLAACNATSMENSILYIQSGGNIIVDVIYVVAIEIYIRRVSLKSRDRFAVRTVLLLMLTATVCCAAKIGDFKGALTSQDITWAVVPPSELSVAEMNLALCAACLPSVRLVLGRYFPRSLCFWRREKKASGDTTWGFTQNVTHKSAVCKPSGTMPSMRSMHRAGDDDDDADCVMKFYGPEDKDNLEAVESEIEAGKISKAMTYRISESYNE